MRDVATIITNRLIASATNASKKQQDEPQEVSLDIDTSPAAGMDTKSGEGYTFEAGKKAKVKIQGYRYLKFRALGASGNESQFRSRVGLSLGIPRIEQGTQFSVTASVGDKTKLKGTLTELPRQDKTTLFEFDHGKYSATFGGFSAELTGGALASLSKSADGIAIEYKTKNTLIKSLTSKSRSQSKSLTFSGRNIKGPYDLNASSLVPESVSVYLNSKLLTKDDYILDPYIGTITFNEIIGPEDSVTVSGEQKLTGSLTEGDINALSVSHTTQSLTTEFMYASKSASRQLQQITTVVSGETPAILDSHRVQVSNPFIVYWNENDSIGSETITKNGVRLTPNVDYNVVADIGAEYIAANYAYGIFVLTEPILTTDTITISYTHYTNDVIQAFTQDDHIEIITDASGTPYGRLSISGSLYYGSENIFLCDFDDQPYSTCDRLQRSRDYSYDWQNDQIIFLTASYLAAEFIYFEGVTTPANTVQSSEYDHTLAGFGLKWKPENPPLGIPLDISFDYAGSEADISSSSISELNIIVRTATDTTLTCDHTLSTADQCTFPLPNQNITSGTFLLYLNEKVSDEAILKSPADYQLNTDRGEVRIYRDIPPATIIYADYQYSVAPSGVTSGSIYQYALNTSLLDTSISYSHLAGDTYFTPIGGANNLLVNQSRFTLNRKIGKSIAIGYSHQTGDSATDFLQTHTKSDLQQNYTLKWTSSFFSTFDISHSQRAQTDDYSPSRTDNRESSTRLSLAFPIPALKNAKTTFSLATNKHDDNIDTGTDTNTTNGSIGLAYKPSASLNITSSLTFNKFDSESTTTSFSSNTQLRNLNVSWKPSRMISLDTKIDQQKKTDSRPSVAPSIINTSTLNFHIGRWRKITSSGISYTREDRPSVYTSSSGSTSVSYFTAVAISSAVSFSPRYRLTENTLGEGSNSSTQMTTYSIEYRPPGKRYNLSFNIDTTTQASHTPSRDTSTDSLALSAIFGYNPSPRWDYALRFKSENISSASSDTDEATLTLRAIHKPPKDKKNGPKQWLTYQNVIKSGTYSTKDDFIELGCDQQLTQLLRLNMVFKKNNYSDAKNTESSYDGTLFEMTLKAVF